MLQLEVVCNYYPKVTWKRKQGCLTRTLKAGRIRGWRGHLTYPQVQLPFILLRVLVELLGFQICI